MKLVFATGNPGKLKEAREILGPGYEVMSPSDVGLAGFDVEETGTTFRENSLIKARALWNACGLPCFADDSGLEVDALDGAPGIYSARYASDHNFASNIDRLLAELNALEKEAKAGTASDRRATLGTVRGGDPSQMGGMSGEAANRIGGSGLFGQPASSSAAMSSFAPVTSPDAACSSPATFPGAARFRCVVTLILPDGHPRFFEGACEGRIARERCGAGGFGYDPVFVPDLYPDVTMAQLSEEAKNAISHRGVALRLMASWLSTVAPLEK